MGKYEICEVINLARIYYVSDILHRQGVRTEIRDCRLITQLYHGISVSAN